MWVAVAVAGGSIVGGMMSADAQEDAANTAANAQTGASQAEIGERRRQFDEIQKLLAPYVSAGSWAVKGQRELIGLDGGGAQQSAIAGLQNSPEFAALTQQGEQALLANASATGGLRGGNVQSALAQFRPQLLAQMIDQQFNRLGGLTSVGQNAAAGVGNAGLSTANGIGGALQQMGAAQAGAALAGGAANAGMWNSISGGIGQFAGLGGFGRMTKPGGGSMNSFGGGGMMDQLQSFGVF